MNNEIFYNECNEKLNFYKVSKDYCKFLRRFDKHVPYIEYPTHDKFFVGVVFCIGEIKYFAPISSYKNVNSTTFNIFDGDKIISSIRLNYMFPIKEGVYEQINIFEDYELKYATLVYKEYDYCNKNREFIFKLAEKIYNQRLNSSDSSFIANISCNFKLLEKKCMQYSNLDIKN